VTFVPVQSTDLGTTGRIGPQNLEEYLRGTRLMLPVSDVDVVIRSPYTSSAEPFTGPSAQNGWIFLVQEIQALRTAEGADRYYHGVLQKSVADGPLGIAYRPPDPASGLRSALSADELPLASTTIAHEFGHNLGQRHAPCGGAGGVDPAYPYSEARLGTPGWDPDLGTFHTGTDHFDVMSYCSPAWISDYMYVGMLDWREGAPAGSPAQVAGAREPVDGVLLWGGWSRSGPELNPIFHLRTVPSALPLRGEGEIRGFDGEGRLLFQLPVAGEELSDVDDESLRHFSLFVPLPDTERTELARIVLSTPYGEVERRAPTLSGGGPAPAPPAAGPAATVAGADRIALEWNAATYPVILIRDAADGTILSFARNGRIEIPIPPSGAVELQMGEGIRVRTEAMRFRDGF
jgi:hypothetical protein